MMPFEFGNISLSEISSPNPSQTSSLMLFSKASGSRGHLLFLTDSLLKSLEVKALSLFLSRSFKDFKFDIISLTDKFITQEELQKYGVLKFFKDNQKDFFKSQIIDGETIVITLGRAIYGLNMALDVSIEDFYDDILGETYFYSPESYTHVFPIDCFEDIFKKNRTTSSWELQDSSKSKFALTQFKKVFDRYEEFKNPGKPPRTSIIRISSAEESERFFTEFKDKTGTVAWDIETSGFDFLKDRIGCVTISFNGKTGYYIPWEYINPDSFNEFLANKYQIGQNLKFDCKFVRHQGISNAKVHSDTMILGQTIGEYKSNSLKALAYYYTPYGGYDRELDDYISQYNPDSYLDIPEKILSKYATMDAIVNYLVHEKMQKQLTEIDRKFPPSEKGAWSMRSYYEGIRIPAVNSFIDIEMGGVYVDMNVWDESSKIAIHKLIDLTFELKESLHIDDFLNKSNLSLAISFGVEDEEDEDNLLEAFNNDYFKVLNSPSKLGKLLEWNGWTDYGRAKNDSYLTGDDQLLRWEKEGHVEATRLKEFRSYRTLHKTFLGTPDSSEGWRKYIRHHEDGTVRIHPSYRVMGAESGRNTCDSPNWQQIPSSSIGADLIKKIVTTPNNEDYYLATLDYSSLQIRLATIDSQDPYLTKIYKNDPNADLHSITAYEVFCSDKEFEVEEITITDNGTSKTFFAFEKLKIRRNGVVMEVRAGDLIETDDLVI